MFAQVAGEAIGLAVELAIGELATLLGHGDGVGREFGHARDPLVDRAAGQFGGRLVPAVEHGQTFGRRQQRQGVDGGGQLLGQTAQQQLELADHARDRLMLEQRGAVLDPAAQAGGIGREAEGQVNLREAAAHGAFAAFEPAEGLVGHGQVEQGEDDLEQRVAGEVAIGAEMVDERVERQLVVDGLARGLGDGGEEGAERGAPAEVGG